MRFAPHTALPRAKGMHQPRDSAFIFLKTNSHSDSRRPACERRAGGYRLTIVYVHVQCVEVRVPPSGGAQKRRSHVTKKVPLHNCNWNGSGPLRSRGLAARCAPCSSCSGWRLCCNARPLLRRRRCDVSPRTLGTLRRRRDVSARTSAATAAATCRPTEWSASATATINSTRCGRTAMQATATINSTRCGRMTTTRMRRLPSACR